MGYLIANIILALVFCGATCGIPLWLVLKRGYGSDGMTHPAAESAAALTADRALPARAELAGVDFAARRLAESLVRS